VYVQVPVKGQDTVWTATLLAVVLQAVETVQIAHLERSVLLLLVVAPMSVLVLPSVAAHSLHQG
jgi:hypothetical protein